MSLSIAGSRQLVTKSLSATRDNKGIELCRYRTIKVWNYADYNATGLRNAKTELGPN